MAVSKLFSEYLGTEVPEAKEARRGRRACFYDTSVTHETGCLIAKMRGISYSRSERDVQDRGRGAYE